MTSIDAIYQITQITLLDEEKKSYRLKQEQESLQHQIDHIDSLAANAFHLLSEDFSRQVLRADALWKRHLAQKRSILVTKLASIRARQEIQNFRLAEAFLQNEALEGLVTKENENANRRRNLKKLNSSYDQILATALSKHRGWN